MTSPMFRFSLPSLLALTVLCFTATATAAGPDQGKKDEKDRSAPPKPERVLRLTLRGTIFESEPPLSMFGSSMGNTLRDIRGAIRKAAKDDGTKALILRLKSPVAGWTQIQALRRELLDFRRTGKPSYCHIDHAGGRSYLLASACSEVSLLPTGFVEIPGVGMYRVYFKGLLDKLGIDCEELRMGRYKSAAEAYTREDPSEAVREESHALIDEIFEEYIASLAENRSLEPVVVRGLVDRALFQPAEAKEAGLVDHVEYEDEFLSRIEEGDGTPRKIVDAKVGKKLELQVGGFAGMMALMNELFGGPKKSRSSKKPKMAVLYGVGAIVQSAQGSLFGGSVMTSDKMVKLFRRVREDDSVKAVVFRVNSPGGSALASDLIWREVKLTAAKKPVVVSMGDLAASGGYYVSCAASWIVAERGTLTGSIGVIGMVPNMRRLHDKIGISYESFSRGKRSEIVSPYGELTEDGRELLLGFMRKIYDDFLGKVAEGRRLPKEAVASIAEGRVWTGGQALKHGLVDELGGLEAALARARELGKLPEDVEVFSLPKPKNFFEILSELEGAAAIGALVRSLPEEVRAPLGQLEWIRAARRERVLAALPAVITVR